MSMSKIFALVMFICLNLSISPPATAQNTKSKTSKNKESKSSIAAYEKYIDDNNEAHLKEFLELVSNKIINKVHGINRVVYDISSKPPSTIEWE